MPDGLKIVVDADVQQATKALATDIPKAVDAAVGSLSKLQKQVAAFGGSVKKYEVEVRSLGAGIAKVITPANRLSPALNKTATSSNAATLSLVNLGRVVQDAPFGFLGIANNLNPLLESFQRLKATTGSTGGALKALGKDMLGAGGLGFAISAVSSLLIVFGDKLFGASQKSKEAAEEMKRVQDVIKSLSGTIAERSSVAAAGAEEEIATINVLSKVVLDQTKSYKERNNALLNLKEINKDYFGDLTLEASSLATLTSRVTEYTNALIAAEVVKAFSSDLGKASVEIAKQISIYNKLGEELDNYNRILERTSESETSLTGEDRVSRKYIQAKKDVDNATKALQKQGNVLKQLTGTQADLRTGLEGAIADSLKFKPLTATPDKVVVKPKEVEWVMPEPKIGKAISLPFVFDFKDLKTGLLEGDIKTFAEQVEDRINAGIKGLVIAPKFIISESGKATKEAIKFADDIAKAFSEGLANALSTGLSGIGEVLGTALGGGDIGSAFKAFAASIGDALQAMGKQIISIGVAALLAKEALKNLFSNPAIAIVAGTALVAAGAALKNILSGGIKGFAQGGLVSGPQLALIGEGSGTSRSNPEVVAPLDKLKAMIGDVGGGRQVVVLRTQISGNNLALVQARTSRSQRRTTGR